MYNIIKAIFKPNMYIEYSWTLQSPCVCVCVGGLQHLFKSKTSWTIIFHDLPDQRVNNKFYYK